MQIDDAGAPVRVQAELDLGQPGHRHREAGRRPAQAAVPRHRPAPDDDVVGRPVHPARRRQLERRGSALAAGHVGPADGHRGSRRRATATSIRVRASGVLDRTAVGIRAPGFLIGRIGRDRDRRLADAAARRSGRAVRPRRPAGIRGPAGVGAREHHARPDPSGLIRPRFRRASVCRPSATTAGRPRGRRQLRTRTRAHPQPRGQWGHERGRAQHRQAGERVERQHPLHDVVGVPAGPPARGRRPDRRRRRGAGAARRAGRQGRRRPRGLRRRGPAGRRRRHGAGGTPSRPRRCRRPTPGFRRTALGRHLDPVWSQMALHRPAEFNRSHIPAFLADEEPRKYVCVYPFVRSYEWYLLPDEERRAMLAEHGKMARGYPDVRANTVASFALGDYEWMLAFEADELHRIVDLMRELRASTGAAARPRGGAVLHRRPQADRRAGRRPGLTRAPRRLPAPTVRSGKAQLRPRKCRTPPVASGHVPTGCVRRRRDGRRPAPGRARRPGAAGRVWSIGRPGWVSCCRWSG